MIIIFIEGQCNLALLTTRYRIAATNGLYTRVNNVLTFAIETRRRDVTINDIWVGLNRTMASVRAIVICPAHRAVIMDTSNHFLPVLLGVALNATKRSLPVFVLRLRVTHVTRGFHALHVGRLGNTIAVVSFDRQWHEIGVAEC